MEQLKMSFRKLFEGLASVTAFTLVFTALVLLPALESTHLFKESTVLAADDEQRKPPEARSSQTLSRRVSSRVVEIMEFRDLEDNAGALEVLGELREMYNDDRLNEREEYTMWLFYATIAQTQTNYEEAIGYFERILDLEENLTADQYQQTLSSVGALNFVLERYRAAIEVYLRYNEVALEPNDDVYLRIATGYYQLEEYVDGIPFVLRNMELVRAAGEEVKESTYSLLRAMYITLEDYPNSLQVLREMIILYNGDDDWRYRASIESQLEMFEEQAYTYYVSNVLGFLDSQQLIMNLAAQLFNNDNPYGAALIVEQGMADGVIEEDERTLSFLSQAFQVAREDAKAVVPLIRAAEMAEDGELYNRLGIIYSTMGDFEASTEAFDMAIEKGDLDRLDQLYMRQARAYLELNRFDEGIEAAREAGKDERSEDTSATWVGVLERAKRRYDIQEANRVLYAGFFR